MISKTDQVRSLFEIPEKYLDPQQYDIRIRVETVQRFTDSLKFDHILDIGCGDGYLFALAASLQQGYAAGPF